MNNLYSLLVITHVKLGARIWRLYSDILMRITLILCRIITVSCNEKVDSSYCTLCFPVALITCSYSPTAYFFFFVLNVIDHDVFVVV